MLKGVYEAYVLGVPERYLQQAARELGWIITATDQQADATHVHVRRMNRMHQQHKVSLPAGIQRRHVTNTFRVQLRMLGA